jgi:tetratricopeptide (TPR) repeat protein
MCGPFFFSIVIWLQSVVFILPKIKLKSMDKTLNNSMDSNAKLFFLLEELKENFSERLLDDTRECLHGEVDIELFLAQDSNRLRQSLNGQHDRFYDFIALDFIEDLNNFPEMYFMVWETFIHYLDEESKNLFLKTACVLATSSEASNYLEGIKHLENYNPELALIYFSNIEDYVADYFIGLCYLEIESYENSIKCNEAFLEAFTDVIEKSKTRAGNNIGISNSDGIRIVLWNLHNDLGYLYNRIADYNMAKRHYEKGLEIFDIEFAYSNKHSELIDKDLSEFQAWINNYLHCLVKTNDKDRAIEILNFALAKYPTNFNYDNLNKKLQTHHPAEDLIKQVYPTKKPYNINKHEQVRFLSREKSLEEMIVEQLKYGYHVFNRPLEIYNKNFYGRQCGIFGGYGILDLLLIDKSTDELFVVELKREKAGLEVVSQIERYIEGLTKQLNREVKGIICVHKPTDQLIQVVEERPNIELFSYQFDFVKH